MYKLFLFLSGKCLKSVKQLQQMGPLHHAHITYCTVCPKLASVDHQCHSSRVWVYLHRAVEKDTRRAAGQDTAFILAVRPMPLQLMPPQLHPGSGRTPALVQSLLCTEAHSGCRFKCLKWSQVLQELLPVTDFVSHKPLRNVLSSTADRVCWQI